MPGLLAERASQRPRCGIIKDSRGWTGEFPLGYWGDHLCSHSVHAEEALGAAHEPGMVLWCASGPIAPPRTGDQLLPPPRIQVVDVPGVFDHQPNDCEPRDRHGPYE